MATGTEIAPLVETWSTFWRARYAGLRTNLGYSRRFFAMRRRDMRFPLVPFGLVQVVNAGAVVLTLLLIVMFVLDPLLVAWQAALPRPVVAFFQSATRFGKSDWMLISTGLFVILMLVLDPASQSVRFRARRAVRSLAAFYVFASVASAGIIANLSKYVIGRARPKFFSETGSVSFNAFSGDASWASFPSGHATNAMALALSLALLFPRLRWVFLSLGFWIAVSRLFTRAHYPSDVLAGGLLGAFAAWLFARAFARYRLVFSVDENGHLVRRTGASGRLF